MSARERQFEILRCESGISETKTDWLAVEEPLEIRIIHGPADARKTKTISVTMRTPGHDFELAVGFLISESIVTSPAHVVETRFAGPVPDGQTHANTVEIELAPSAQFEPAKLQRHFYTTSSCGVCGKSSLDAIRADCVTPLTTDWKINPSLIHELPDLLRQQQTVFDRTGGLHAAGLVSKMGAQIAIREDVGRHNAVDKLIGSQLLAKNFPLSDHILMLSGRASFELLQKALLASIPIVVAVGAPSSLAVELATEFNITLIGFTSAKRFNLYSGWERIGT